MKKHQKNRDMVILVLIAIIVLSVGLINIDLPGVYFDSAITDYLAALVVYPEMGNQETTMSHVGLPLLGSVYHGTTSMFLQIIVLSLLQASVATLRIPYLIYYIIAVFFVYKIICTISSEKAAIAGAIILSGMIYAVTLTRTQYDIMLPGAIFFLLAIYILLSHLHVISDNTQRKKIDKYSFLTGFCLGMAFYDYFCFLFFAPVFMFVLWRGCRKYRMWPQISYITGLISGSALYFFGYADSLLTNILGKGKNTFAILIFCITLFTVAAGIPTYFFLCEKEKGKFLKKYYTVGFIISIVGALVVAMLFFPLIKEKLLANGLNVIGKNVGIKERVLLFFHYFYQAASNFKCEQMINGEISSAAPLSMLGIFIFVQIIFYLWWVLFQKGQTDIRKINILNSFFVCYYIVSLPFIARMQPQHFIPVLFIMPAILFSEIECMINVLEVKSAKNLKIAMAVAIVVLLILNVHDHIAFQNILKKTKGVSAYSVEINLLAEEALERQKCGCEDIYIFAEPGLIPAFIYLTGNAVKTDILYSTNGDLDKNKLEMLDSYLRDDIQINIIAKSYNEGFFAERLSDKYKINVCKYTDNQGNFLFHKITVESNHVGF